MYFQLLCWSYLALSLTACKPVQEPTVVASFRMSDEMLKKCPTVSVVKENVSTEMRLFGKVEPDNNKLAQVYSILGGNVISINVELGDYVQKGQVMAVVRSSEVAEFQKELLSARSDLEMANKNLQVAKDMNESKLNSDRDVKIAEREVSIAKSELSRIKEVYGIYQLEAGSTFKIVAPISGFIVQKDINQNELLRPDNSSVLFSIAEINEIWVMAYVNESDIPKIQVGYEAEVRTLSFPDEVYKGKIDKIFNTIDPETKSMKVLVKIPNPNFKLKPEMSATITVHNTENQQKNVVPSSAVIFDKSKNWVVVFNNRGDIDIRRVEIARTFEGKTYINHGLKEGEKVIYENALLVYNAMQD